MRGEDDDAYYAYHLVSQTSSSTKQPSLDRSRSHAPAQSLPSMKRANSQAYYSLDYDDPDSVKYGSSTYGPSEKSWKEEFDEGRALKTAWAPAWDEPRSRWSKVSKSWLSRLLFLLLLILAAVLVPVFVVRAVRHGSNTPLIDTSYPALANISAAAVSTQAQAQPSTSIVPAVTTITSYQTSITTIEVVQTLTLYQPRQTTIYQTSYAGGVTSAPQVYTIVQNYTAPVTATLSSISGAPAAQPTSVSSFPSGAAIYSDSYATFFLQENRAGNCGTVHSDSDFVVALTTAMYGSGQFCGKTVLIRRISDGATVTATVADSCPTCVTATSLDLSVAAFLKLGTSDEGTFPIVWAFLD